MNAQAKLPEPNTAGISAHLHALFPPDFVHPYPEALIEIAYGVPGKPNRAELFSAFRLDAATDFAVARNLAGDNVYVGAALRKAGTFPTARTNEADFLAGLWTWTDHDRPGDFDRAEAAAKKHNLAPGMIVTTGTVPHIRAHCYFRIEGGVADFAQMRAINQSVQKCLGGDAVSSPAQILRLAGTVNYPTPDKFGRGYVVEPATVRTQKIPHRHPVRTILDLPANDGGTGGSDGSRKNGLGFDIPRGDDELSALMEASRTPGNWHNSMRSAIATMIGREWSDLAIRLACAPYCAGGAYDPDLDPLIGGARDKWGRPNPGDGPRGGSQGGFGAAEPPTLAATPWVWRDPKTIPPREFLYGKHYIRKFVSAGFGAPGGGKSSRRLIEALAMASGRPLLGFRPVAKLKVWYWGGEDPSEETDRRLAAACQHYGIKPDEIDGYLFTDSGRTTPLVIAQQFNTGTRIVHPVVAGLKDAIRDRGIDVMTLDPFVSCHRVAENDNPAIDAVVKKFAEIADATNCSINLEHHIRKTNGNEATVDDGRGASSLVGAARSIEVLNKMTAAEGEKLGLDEHWRYFSVNDGKANMAPLGERRWFRLSSVDLGNGTDRYPEGDNVGVVTAWKPPDHTDGVTGKHFDLAAAKIRAGSFKESSQAKDWVGIPIAKVLGADLATKDGKAKVKSILDMWIKSGALVVVKEMDPERREEKRFVRVADDE